MHTVHRVESNAHGTFGVLSVNGNPVCVTLEETWMDNIPNESCIPEGVYEFKKYSSARYPDVWEIINVPKRSDILIHWGNTERDTAGCVLVGKYFAEFEDRRGVADSRRTIKLLRKMLPDKGYIAFVDCFR